MNRFTKGRHRNNGNAIIRFFLKNYPMNDIMIWRCKILKTTRLLENDLELILSELKCNIGNGMLGLGLLIDKLHDDNEKSSLMELKDFLQNNIYLAEDTEYLSTYLYFFANVLSDIGDEEKAVLNFRKAIIDKSFKDLNCQTKAAIHVNLGNIMNKHGRYAEALESYGKSLEESPDFLMALGNLGICLKTLSYSLYDINHRIIALRFSYSYLTKAIEQNKDRKILHATAQNGFNKAIEEIDEIFSINNINKEITEFKTFDVRSKKEDSYKKWCLDNTLFLNPMNDIIKHTVSAHDVVHLPNMTFDINDDSIYGYLSMFNQLKQEYVSARFLYYDSINNKKFHFSDRAVGLINPLSYQEYSYNIEKCKIAFRIIYSLLDKIGFFINEYYNLGIDKSRVNFSKAVNALKLKQDNIYNWSIDALCWVNKEINFGNEINPYSLKINNIRNHLEHKFFQVITYGNYDCVEINDILTMGRMEFEEITLNLIKIVRSAIISLSLAIHRNENIKTPVSEEWLTMPIPHTGFIDDKWKV